ncbi:hypothetical protein BMG_4450 [Priestia megaterium]|nr:hypothetical protein BMG_4450 [Priestia megaterium]
MLLSFALPISPPFIYRLSILQDLLFTFLKLGTFIQNATFLHIIPLFRKKV